MTATELARRVRVSWPLIVAYLVLVLLVLAASRGALSSLLGGDPAPNAPGDARAVLLTGLVEVLVAASLLRFWSYRHAWARAAAVAVLLGAWALVNLFWCLECGPVGRAHTLWLFACTGAALILAVYSAEMRRRGFKSRGQGLGARG